MIKKQQHNEANNEVYSSKVRVRFYVPEAQKGRKIVLNPEQLRHLKVLRLKAGEKFTIFDGKGNEYEAIYSGKVSESTSIEKQLPNSQKELKTNITLAIAVPKGKRADVLVEKVSELGISKLVPIICSRSVVNPHEAKVERWRKVAIEACSQSERNIVPIISESVLFSKFLETIKEYNQAFLCHKTGLPLLNALKEVASTLLIIGPEGDFTPTEIQAAKEAGCIIISLGPTVLRVETAGITAVAQVVGMSEKAT